MRIGVEVVTGFLGDGKSTFINQYIKYTKVCGERIIVICYEDGVVKIKDKDTDDYIVKMVYIDNEKSTLNNNIKEIINEYKPHRIIIEYNGTLDIMELFKELKKKDSLNSIKLFNIIFVGSGKNIQGYIKNLGEFINPFIENSDIIAINNINNKSQQDIKKIKEYFEETNHKAHIFIKNTNEEILENMNYENLIYKEKIRKFKMKLIDYSNKW